MIRTVGSKFKTLILACAFLQAAAFLRGPISHNANDAQCLVEWSTCSPDDDLAAACCEGLYCWIQDAYYAQCRKASVGSPTMQPTIKQKPQNSSKYQCGAITTSSSDYVQTEYTKWKSQYIISSSKGACVSQPSQGQKCVSEGLGYGMILAAIMSDKTTFDNLWTFAKNGVDQYGLPNWQFSSTGDIWGMGSATDADVDIALGLLMAADRWNPGNNASPYLEAARNFIGQIMKHDIDATTLMALPGDSWVTGQYAVPYNPSYFSPAHFQLFAKATGDARWTTAVANGYKLLTSDCAGRSLSGSGLVPDWTASLTSCAPGSPFIDFDQDKGADYYYDAIRAPWRLALHAAWTCDPTALGWTAKMANFFVSRGVSGLQQGFRMDGTSLGGGDSLCFIAMSATAMVPGQSQNTVNSWYEATKSTTAGGGLYYCDTLRMLSLSFQAGLMTKPNVA